MANISRARTITSVANIPRVGTELVLAGIAWRCTCAWGPLCSHRPPAAPTSESRFVAQDPTRQQTVYTVRFTTGRGRGAGMEEPDAGVFMCLIGADGASFLHRVGPLYDAEAAEADLHAICEVRERRRWGRRHVGHAV